MFLGLMEEQHPLPDTSQSPPLPFILTAAALTTASLDRCCSVAQLWLTLCKSTDCSTSGFPVLHQLPEVYSNSCPLSPWMAPPIALCLGQPPRQIFFLTRDRKAVKVWSPNHSTREFPGGIFSNITFLLTILWWPPYCP